MAITPNIPLREKLPLEIDFFVEAFFSYFGIFPSLSHKDSHRAPDQPFRCR